MSFERTFFFDEPQGELHEVVMCAKKEVLFFFMSQLTGACIINMPRLRTLEVEIERFKVDFSLNGEHV